MEVPATAARRVKAWDLSLDAASELSCPSWSSTFAPTVPIQPAYASITPLPIAMPGGNPI